jgi:hypothetical protein
VQRVPYYSQSVELTGGFAEVSDKRYRRQAHRSLRKANAAGLDVREYVGAAAEPAVDVFAGLYALSIDRWAAAMGRPLPIARLHARLQDRAGHLRSVVRSMGDMVRMWTAHKDGEPVSVLVVLDHGAHSFGWLAAMNAQLSNQTAAGYLLESTAIEAACAAGREWFHMGESAPGSAIERFKGSFGAVPFHYEALVTERLPLTAADRTLRRAVDVVGKKVSALRESRQQEQAAQAAK